MARLGVLSTAVLLVAVLAAACSSGPPAGVGNLPLTTVWAVRLPGRSTRFDYADVDPGRHLLVVAHLGDSTVVALDVATRAVVWQAHGIASVHGVRAVPSLGLVFATATGTNEVVALDEATGAEQRRAPTGPGPDGVAYDPATGRLLVSDMNGDTVTVVDAHSMQPVGRVRVGSRVGNLQTGPGGVGLAAAGSTNTLAVFSPATLTVDRQIALPGCRGAHGVQQAGPLVWVACEDDATAVAVDLAAGRVVARIRVGATPDVVAYDAAAGRLYVAAESGEVTVVDTAARRVIARRRLAPGAHTVAVDPADRLVLFPLAAGPRLVADRPSGAAGP